MRITALIGNGCSIAYNPEFRMDPLTERILREFAGVDSAVPEVAEVLNRLADAAVREPDERKRFFEALFGPIERMGRGLQELRALSDLVGAGTEVTATFDRAARFGEELRRRTIGSALQVVASLSNNKDEQGKSTQRQVVNWLNDARGDEGTVEIFTLNYDALIDGAVVDLTEERSDVTMSDMAQGYGWVELQVTNQGDVVPAAPLRDDDVYPAQFIVFHLHGSLQWLRTEGGWVYKVKQIDHLRDVEFWRRHAAGATPVEPVVILADQKEHAVKADPFRWAYDRLEESLKHAEAIVIIGYGFGDSPVNRALARGLWGKESPVKVIDHTDDTIGTRDRLVEATTSELRLNDRGATGFRARLRDRVEVAGYGIPDSLQDLSLGG